jgi:hypothetical protein
MKIFNKRNIIIIIQIMLLCGLHLSSLANTIIMDNGKVGYVETGTWSTSWLTDSYGGTNRYTTTVGSYATWTPTLSAGNYEVWVYKLVHSECDPATKIEVCDKNNITRSFTFDNNITGPSGWVKFGEFSFGDGVTGWVRMTCMTQNKTTRADAVKFVEVSNAPPTPPTATNVKITGKAFLGDYLLGSYIYNDLNLDVENGSTFSWQRSDFPSGTFVNIPGATGMCYLTTNEDINKFLRFAVIPRTLTSPTDGEITYSSVINILNRNSVTIYDPLVIDANIHTNTLNASILKYDATTIRATTSLSKVWSGVGFTKPNGLWDFTGYGNIKINVFNPGTKAVTVAGFAEGAGWGAAGSAYYMIQPEMGQSIYINLNATLPDRTYFVDPSKIQRIRLIIKNSNTSIQSDLDLKKIEVVDAANTVRTAYRLFQPILTEELPAPGKRVKQVNNNYNGTDIYHTLYLPTDYQSEKKYPIIIEYTGSEYYESCYSTGYPENGNMGFGMSKGEGFICLQLPFVDPVNKKIDPSGWGDADATADYCIQAVKDVCEKFGGDPAAVFITGFSRGAIALGYIGLRNDKIADLWLGFHAIQHYYGDGWGGANFNDALSRASRIKGRATFHTDNPAADLKTIYTTYGYPVIYEASGLGYHSDVMLMDNRQSTLNLRTWMLDVMEKRYGTHSIKGRVIDKLGNPIKGARVETGETHFSYTDRLGNYEIKSIIDGTRIISIKKEGFTFEPSIKTITLAGYDLENINFSSIETTTSYENPTCNNLSIIVSKSNKDIVILNIPANSLISFYTLSGNKIFCSQGKTEGYLIKGNLPRGIYFVNVQNEHYNFSTKVII